MPDTGGPTTLQLQKEQLFDRTLKVTGAWVLRRGRGCEAEPSTRRHALFGSHSSIASDLVRARDRAVCHGIVAVVKLEVNQELCVWLEKNVS